MAEQQRYPFVQNILNAKATTGVGAALNVRDYQNIQLSLATAGSANLTVKIQGSCMATSGDLTNAPDFSVAASATNRWDYIACFDLIDPTTVVPGSTGFSAAGTDICKNILVNVDGIMWINVSVTARSAGNVTTDVLAFNNQ